jgi:hypothetical protein
LHEVLREEISKRLYELIDEKDAADAAADAKEDHETGGPAALA